MPCTVAADARDRWPTACKHPRSRLEGQHPCISWGLRLATASGRSIATIGAQEIEHNRSIASHPATDATAIGGDPGSWKLIQMLVSENEPSGTASGVSYQILYLAKLL